MFCPWGYGCWENGPCCGGWVGCDGGMVIAELSDTLSNESVWYERSMDCESSAKLSSTPAAPYSSSSTRGNWVVSAADGDGGVWLRAEDTSSGSGGYWLAGPANDCDFSDIKLNLTYNLVDILRSCH